MDLTNIGKINSATAYPSTVAKAVKEAQDAALKAVGDLAAAPVVGAVRKALGK